MTRVLPKVLLCLFMFEAVHRRSNSLKTFHLQFRLGSFQTHGRRGTGWKLRQYRCSGLFERWLECDSIRFPGSSEFTFAKRSCTKSNPSPPSTKSERPRRAAGDISVIFCDCHLECNGIKECATSHEGEKHLLAFAQRHLACLQLSFELRRARTSKICS